MLCIVYVKVSSISAMLQKTSAAFHTARRCEAMHMVTLARMHNAWFCGTSDRFFAFSVGGSRACLLVSVCVCMCVCECVCLPYMFASNVCIAMDVHSGSKRNGKVCDAVCTFSECCGLVKAELVRSQTSGAMI